MSQSDFDAKGRWFQAAIRSILKPLARALIRHGVTAPAVYRLLKQAYVEVAAEEFGLDGAPPTDSRISVLTGVHRRDVKALREAEPDDDAGARRKISVVSLVIGRWLASPETTDAGGAPIPLPRSGDAHPNFEDLVVSVSKDVRPRTVLDELVNQELATIGEAAEGELVTLRPDAIIGPADLEQRMHFFAANLCDHIAAAAANLSDGPTFMERAVYYNRMTPDSVDSLEEAARSVGNDALIELNRRAHAMQLQDAASPDGIERFRFGVYFYRVVETPSDAQEKSAEKGGARQEAGGGGKTTSHKA